METVEIILLLFFLLILIVDEKIINKIFVRFSKLYRVWLIAIAAIFILTQMGREYLFENLKFTVCLLNILVFSWLDNILDIPGDNLRRLYIILAIAFMLVTVLILYKVWFI